MAAKKPHVKKYLRVLFSEPIFILISFLVSFLIANSKIRYFDINAPFIYSAFLKNFLRYYTTITAIFLLFRLKSKVMRIALLGVIIYSFKFAGMKFLAIISALVTSTILKPSGINFSILFPAISFFIGLLNSPFTEKEVKYFLILPYIICSLRTDGGGRELSSVIFTLFFSFVSRPIGMINGIFFIISKRVSVLFPVLGAVFSIPLSVSAFSAGYFYFLEFQKGIPIEAPFIFLSKIHIPVILGFLPLVLYILRIAVSKYLEKRKRF